MEVRRREKLGKLARKREKLREGEASSSIAIPGP